MMQLQLLPDNIDTAALAIHDRSRARAWDELKSCCRIIGQYRNILWNDYYYSRRRPEALDILVAMDENEQRVKLARQLFNNGNYRDTLRVLAEVVW